MIEITECAAADIPELARMRLMNIEDEGNLWVETPAEAEKQLEEFLGGTYKAFFFNVNGRRVGCTLCDMAAKPPYLRQFHILREHRRKGYGREAFRALVRRLGADELMLGVLPGNARGMAFWKSLGFEAVSIRMYYNTPR